MAALTVSTDKHIALIDREGSRRSGAALVTVYRLEAHRIVEPAVARYETNSRGASASARAEIARHEAQAEGETRRLYKMGLL